MEFKKIMLILITAIFLVSIAGVCAADANDTIVASDDANQMDLSSNDVIVEDNLQTGEKNTTLMQANDDETVSAESGSQILSEGEGTYYDLINEIGDGGDKSLAKSYYSYTGGNTIEITTPGTINCNGAVIDMAGSTIRAFYVSASGVTIKNLTIKNTNNNAGSGGAIYFSSSGIVENCNFINNTADDNGGAINFADSGIVTNCNFTDNRANNYGGAININSGTITNCNFTNNCATNYDGGAININSGTVENCTFIGNKANGGGAMREGYAINCRFIENHANNGYGGAINGYNHKSVNCTFTSNTASADGGALSGGEAHNCSFISNVANNGGAINNGNAYTCNFTGNHAVKEGGAKCGGNAINCTFINNTAYAGAALRGGEAHNCNFTDNHAAQDGGAVFKCNAYDCTFKGNTARYGGAFYENEAYNCNFINNTASEQGGAIFKGKADNCNFTDNRADKEGGAMFEGTAGLCFLNTSSDTLHNTNILPIFTVSKPVLRFDSGDRLLFNLTYDNKNYDGYNTTITLTQDGGPVSVYYALSGSDEGWYADLKPGIYVATLSMEQYTVKPITVNIITGNAGTYSELSREIASGGGVINLQHDFYVYDEGSSIEITTPNTVINGNGAIIDMDGSNIRAFYVSASGVTIRNLTIKNANVNGDGGAIYFGVAGTVENCTFIGNKANGGGAMYEGIAINCRFIENHANSGCGGAINGYNHKSVNCTFISNTASADGGALSGGEAHNCSFISNVANNGGAINDGKIYNCNFTDNHAVNEGGAMYRGTSVFNNFKTSSDTTYNTNLPTFTVSKSYFIFDSGEKLLFNLTCDNKNYDGYNTTITLTKDGNPVGVYYALSGSDEGWYADLSPGIYMATLSMEQYHVKPITVNIITGNASTYSELSREIASGGGVINLQHDFYVYDEGSSIEITTPNTVINGNGAIIDMDGSNIRAFYVSASGVTIRNLTIKNANVNGDGGAIYFNVRGTVENCTFMGNKANGGGAMCEGIAINCRFIENSANGAGGAINGYNHKSINCTFISNSAGNNGGALSGGEAHNCSFISNVANNGGAINDGKIYNCNFTDNHAVNEGGAMYGGTSVFNIFKTSSDTIYNANLPTFTVSKSLFRFDSGDRLQFRLTCDNKNYDGYNTTITLTKDGNPVGVYYALSGSDEGWYADLSPGIYMATLSMEQYAVKPITVEIITGNASTYSELSREIASGGGVINLQYGYYVYDEGSSIEITTPNTVINGNGAIINMAGSTIRAFTVSASGVTIKNLTIKNANYKGEGGAIYFSSSGTVTNCNFADNKATGTNSKGGAIRMSSGSVTNCNFINNTASYWGGAIYFYENSIGNVTNCNFTNNSVTGKYGEGGAIWIYSGTVTNCNFADNKATSTKYFSFGGAIHMSSGSVTNCNFTDNSAHDGGAIGFDETGTVTNCNFINNHAIGEVSTTGEVSKGGAIRMSSGSVTNCNFTNNQATGSTIQGGAIYMDSGSVTNCNFTANQVTGTTVSFGGAIYMSSGSVTNCNFADNKAGDYGGAVYIRSGSVTNCNFTNNSVTGKYGEGGAIGIYSGTVTNCNFIENTARIQGGAIYSAIYWSTADTCIFKTGSDTTNEKVIIVSPKLNVDNFTTFYGSGEKLIFNLTTNSNMPVNNGNISISVYLKNNNSWVGNYRCLSDEGWIPDLRVGYYYAIFDTEYAGFQKINRTITVIIPAGKYYVNVTSLATNNKTVNITAKTNIPQNITWDGKLLFILPNSTQINANYAGNGTWWAAHRFDDYGVYQVNASYDGLDNVTVSNGKITIKVDSTITLDNITLSYGESKNVTVATQGATGITADINGINVTVINNYTIQINDLAAGNYTLTVTTIPDGGHNPVTATSKITVNKIESTLMVNNVELDYGDSINVTVTALGATGITAKIDNVNVTVNGYTIPISGLDVGTYNLTVTTIADANHNPVTRNATVTVNRAKTELAADAIITTYSVSKDLVITLKDSRGKPLSGFNITVDFNGTKNYTTDTSGQVKISTKGLVANIYEVLMTFNGTDNYVNCSKTTRVSIYKESSIVDTKPLTTVYNVHKYLVVGLKDKEGNPIRNADAYIEIHGVTYKCRSDDVGNARLIIRLNPGTYTAKITFDNVNYTGFTQYVTVIVKKATPKLTAKKKTFKAKKKVKRYTVTLKDNNGKAMAKVKLTLKIKGKTYKAKTNAKGKATFKIKKLTKKGKYKATVKFAGNNCYNKVTKKVKITIK